MKIRPSLRSAFTLCFLMTAILPLLVIGLVSLHLLTKNIEKSITDKNSLLAISLAARVETFLSEPTSLLELVRKAIETKGYMPEEQLGVFLEMLVRQYDFFDGIQIVDANGFITKLAPFRADQNGIDMSNQEFFKETRRLHRPWWSNTFISIDTGMPTLTVTRPLEKGMIVGYLNLFSLGRIIDQVKIGHDGYAAIVDRNGIAIAHPEREFVSQRLNVKNLGIVQQGIVGRQGTFEYRYEGIEKLGSVAVIPQTGWLLMVVQGMEEALAPVRKVQKVFLSGLVMAMAMALAIAMVTVKKTLNPFSQLVSAVRKIAEGHYQVEPLRKSYPEIDELVDGFRMMSETIEARAEALRISEERYRSLVEDSFDGIFIQTGTKIIFANRRLHTLLGYRENELIGMDHWLLYHGKYQELAKERAQARMRGEPAPTHCEVKLQRKDGTWFFAEISAAVVEIDGAPGIQVWIKDNTERKQAEASTRESEKRFRDLFNSISDLIYTQDLQGKFLTANPSMNRIFGYDSENFIGRAASDFMKPELRPYFESEYLEKLKRDGHYAGISAYFTKGGRQIYLEYRSTLVRPADGEPYISGIAREVSERILAEREIKKLQEQMLQSKKMEAIGVLAGGLAHDFNNLLMGIQGNASLALLNMEPGSSDHDRLKNIEKYVQQGADLTNQLLGLARGGKYEVKPTDLNELVNAHNRMFGRTRKEIKIQEKLKEGLWTVRVDQGQIRQVLLNLCINAWQAMPGGGDLYIETNNVVLQANDLQSHHMNPGNYVKISVTDSGVGMDESTMQRIFDPFFTTKGMGRGTGLGLASAYGIIKNHGGVITVYSKKGKGATFNIYLPAEEDWEDVEQAGNKNEKEIIHGSGTVLLVDDEEMIVEVGEQMLLSLGYTVLTARNGGEAIELFREKKSLINLIILDMIMPGMGGGETYEHLKELDPGVRVLLASGYSLNGDAQEILNRGCAGFIQKPFNMEELSSKLKEILAKQGAAKGSWS